jgi:hypothetical protein
MTMHLAHPALSTTGKKRGKQKYASAEHARRARELDDAWKDMQKKWGVDADEKRRQRALAAEPLTYKLSTPIGRSNTHNIPSLVTPGASTASVHKVYTGTKVKGIATMHKSNAVPVFSDEEAVEISRMRRG